MTTYVYPADTHGCGYYRLIWPAQALRALGYDIKIIMPKERGNSLRATLDGDGNITDVEWPNDADAIVLQRITDRRLADAIRIMVGRGLKVIIDMDDDLASIDPNNPAWQAMHPRHGYSPNHNWQNTQRACDAASLVTVSTDALLTRYARHGRGVILRNCVPKRYLEIEHIDSDVVGWGGSLHVHPSDVQVLGSTISVLTLAGMRFRVVGPGDGVADTLRCASEAVEVTGSRDLLTEWAESLATLGVGVAPLADTRFNTAKSWLKVLEYSALGVPWVASSRVEYQRAHELSGTGVLVDKPKHWLRELRILLNDKSLRHKASKIGREWAATQTIEGNALRWGNAWGSRHVP